MEMKGIKIGECPCIEIMEDKESNAVRLYCNEFELDVCVKRKDGEELYFCVDRYGNEELEKLFPMRANMLVQDGEITIEEDDDAPLWIGMFTADAARPERVENAIAILMDEEALEWSDQYVIGFVQEGGKVVVHKLDEDYVDYVYDYCERRRISTEDYLIYDDAFVPWREYFEENGELHYREVDEWEDAYKQNLAGGVSFYENGAYLLRDYVLSKEREALEIRSYFWNLYVFVVSAEGEERELTLSPWHGGKKLKSLFPLKAEKVEVYNGREYVKVVFHEAKEGGELWHCVVNWASDFVEKSAKKGIVVKMNFDAEKAEDEYVVAFLREGGEFQVLGLDEDAYEEYMRWRARKDYDDWDKRAKCFSLTGKYVVQDGKVVFVDASRC